MLRYREEKAPWGGKRVRETYRDPIYNLKAVVGETGITADALRAWERRYELPQPARTEAGHRVYSRRDIDIIKWLVARQAEGLRIGRAVKLWNSLEEEGYDPLLKAPLPTGATSLRRGGEMVDLREDWVTACLSFDEQSAEETLAQAFALYPPEPVLSGIIREGIAQIGELWYAGEATVQQEHFASQLAIRHIESLIRAVPRPTRRGRVLIACPPAEEHTLGPLLLDLLLRRAGWDVINLGADVPTAEIERTVESTDPQLVILAAQQLRTAGNLLDMSQAIQGKGVPVAFGGGIFNRWPRLRDGVPGHFLGQTVEEAVQATENLIGSRVRKPRFAAPPQAYQQALACCLDQLLLLEARVWTLLDVASSDQDSLRELNEEFIQAVVAALKLGDIGLVADYLDWLEGKGDHMQVPSEMLRGYLEAYHGAAAEYLDERGAPIIDWLDERLGSDGGTGESAGNRWRSR
jgi:methanogenic corrinoid protein MtbC1